MVALGGVTSEEYGHDGSGVCLGDGRRRPREYRREVDAAPANAPIPDLT